MTPETKNDFAIELNCYSSRIFKNPAINFRKHT
jgi:hypothetical protein